MVKIYFWNITAFFEIIYYEIRVILVKVGQVAYLSDIVGRNVPYIRYWICGYINIFLYFV